MAAPTEGRAVGTRTATDPDDWVATLRAAGPEREAAIARLHALLLRAARYELNRRRVTLGHIPPGEVDDLAAQAADDALVAILAKLDTFRGASRFTTWAYKFALLEAGVKARRRAWHDREVPFDDDMAAVRAGQSRSAQDAAEESELLRAVQECVRTALTDHQRKVFSALALNEVPIDVLAERLSTTRGALYKTLHDARRKLRTELAAAGHRIEGGES